MHSNAREQAHSMTSARHRRLDITSRGPQAGKLMTATALMVLSIGCHHHKQQVYGPPPPPLSSHPSHRSSESNQGSASVQSLPHGLVAEPKGKPILVETGMASWYGPSGHRSADGSVYDGKSMTAAHKTLPLGTVARVTNLVNGESVMVRITDRGPFAHGRVLDLSEGAAKEIGLYRMGVAKVKIEAYGVGNATSGGLPPISAGKWCVQTGAFKSQQDALDLKTALMKRYIGSRVIEFAGATGYWVRIDPAQHDHADAAAIKEWIGNPDPQVVPYLVRLD